MGIMDETGFLGHGQVYINITRDIRASNKTYIAIKGPVAVTKNPALAPGDMRVLEAVGDCTLLSHYRDCLVFPSKGKRPHPSECSGSLIIRLGLN
mmetsp:Transcript_24130/g.26798  ORF Transcript_24130/g.26798 Transcript_24130/m.26798 type:complete len:95 (+) Transcript_24130:117-401(+)